MLKRSLVFTGLLAVIAPKLFGKVAEFWGTWITTRPTVPYFDARIDVDQFVLRRTRLFGWLVVGLTIFCAVMLTRT